MKRFDDIVFASRPIMLAAWPGMGNVGLIAMDYIRRKLNATLFAEIDMSPFFIPDSIIVQNGMAQFPEIPTSTFHFSKNPDIIIFESNAQISGRDGITIIKTILDIAQRYNVVRIFTSAAFAQPMSFRNDSEVLCASNAEPVRNILTQFDIIPMSDGVIAGLNGLLLGVAASRKLEAACLLGTIPSYATNLSYPKASLQIIRNIDITEMQGSVEEMDLHLATIEERIKEFFSNQGEQSSDDLPKVDDEKVPHYIMDKIEQLFTLVEKDKTRAQELKSELDRWSLYELYEKRFLDLFKEKRE
jgi:proteasome assembly chaperone (PAC2) family protein